MKLPPVTIANRSSFLIVNGDCRNVNKNSILEKSKIITRFLRLTHLLNRCYTGQWANNDKRIITWGYLSSETGEGNVCADRQLCYQNDKYLIED